MAVRYIPHDAELVSEQWKTVMVEMDKAGNNEVVEGHRTMERQRYFWDCYQCQCCNNGNRAAFPSANAPHIRTGRIDHAMDMGHGGAAVSWLRSHSINAGLPVGGEPWHVEADAGDLERFHKKNKADKWEPLPDHIEKDVRRLIFHRHGAADQKGKNKKKYEEHKKWRTYHRRRLLRALKRADKPQTKKLLRDLLDVDKRKHANPPRSQ